MIDAERREANRVRIAQHDAAKVKAAAVSLAVAAWLGVDNDCVQELGETIIVRGEAVQRLAEMAGVGDDGPKAARVEISVDLGDGQVLSHPLPTHRKGEWA